MKRYVVVSHFKTDDPYNSFGPFVWGSFRWRWLANLNRVLFYETQQGSYAGSPAMTNPEVVTRDEYRAYTRQAQEKFDALMKRLEELASDD